MRSLFLLLLSFIFLFAAKAQEVEQRVINGDIVDASDPAGNIPTCVSIE